ncbi:Poly-N-acetyllactosamine extension enzyme [Caenorhabditis elegans]|uniref:Poly-N-acetyllactosamine extension enzyme n=1 Tax=Caenorhabditis elegans TaxID=6239 RepID=Q18754_CAEEL|nr:Poly-N-acetyllactosamine extension enzyme [Caenorhabditis elegans]CCD67455.1 Poly-N-acetyllactosamine extension enzyme [Caenorhabditis elegans]|eukprot:NP_501267.1 Uncharacterized protein CELE_C50F7.9 [Caenorhabditis elegans]
MKSIRFNNPLFFIVLVFVIQLSLIIFRVVFIGKPASSVRAARECLHIQTNTAETDDQFFGRMWPSLHQVVDKCSYRHFRDRVKVFGSSKQYILWLNWLVDNNEHMCNSIFIHNSKSIAMEREFKRYNRKCVIYSLSDKHTETSHYQDPRYSVLTLKQNVSSQARHLGWGVDHYARDSNAVDLTYFTVVQVHKLRYDSVNIFYDGSQHIKALFTKSAFDEANLVSCQFNILYDRPKGRLARREFRATWKKLLYDRRYFVASVRRISGSNDKISILLLNICDPYCWAKYISNQPFLAKNV